jgi:hypothetical protein
MNPNQFTSKIYGYSTSDTMKNTNITDKDMKSIVENVLHKMNTQPHQVSYYNSVPNYSPPTYLINRTNQVKTIEKKNQSYEFTPEFYNVLKSMISNEIDKKMLETSKMNKTKEPVKQNILKKLNYCEKKLDFLEEQILSLKNNFL